MFPVVFFLLVAMPIVEIALLIQVGSAIGALNTILIVIATALLGSFMLRQQGLSTLQRARNRLDQGEVPAMQLMEGLLLAIGGVLLLTPGFVTDAFGFACLFPVTRQYLARTMANRAVVGVATGGQSPFSGPAGSAGQSGPGNANQGRGSYRGGCTGDNDVIEGEYRRED